jgi:hypothetical protein
MLASGRGAAGTIFSSETSAKLPSAAVWTTWGSSPACSKAKPARIIAIIAGSGL